MKRVWPNVFKAFRNQNQIFFGSFFWAQSRHKVWCIIESLKGRNAFAGRHDPTAQQPKKCHTGPEVFPPFLSFFLECYNDYNSTKPIKTFQDFKKSHHVFSPQKKRPNGQNCRFQATGELTQHDHPLYHKKGFETVGQNYIFHKRESESAAGGWAWIFSGIIDFIWIEETAAQNCRGKPKRRFFRTLGMGARSFGAIGLLISQGKGFIQRDKNCILSQHTGLKHFNIHSISRCFGCQTWIIYANKQNSTAYTN